MDTLITRQDAIDEVMYWHGIDVSEAIEKTKSANCWISTDAALPKENEYEGNVRKHYLIQDEYGDMHVASFRNDEWIPIRGLDAIEDRIVAWQPLPKKWKGENYD